MERADRPRSAMWFLLPICMGVLGGAIAYFAIRYDDPRKARNCLYLGLIMLAVGIGINLALWEGQIQPVVDMTIN